MQPIRKITEKVKPTLKSLEIIDRVISQINSDNIELENWFFKYANSHKVRLAYDLDYLLEFAPRKSKVIEFGAIPLILTTALKEHTHEITGVDIAPERFSKIIENLNLNVVKANIELSKLPFEPDSFDVALFNELFEHLRINPIFTMQEVRRVLKPGGILLLSTPNLTSLKGWINLVFRNKAPGNVYMEYLKLEKLGHMGHVREYTTTEVCSFLEQCGFTVKAIIYRGAPIPKKRWKLFITNILFAILPRFRRYFTIVAIK